MVPILQAETDKMKREELKKSDWERFANALGDKELLRLDGIDVMYHLPPPGVR